MGVGRCDGSQDLQGNGEFQKAPQVILMCLLYTQELKEQDAAEKAGKGSIVVCHPIWLKKTTLNSYKPAVKAKWAKGRRISDL